MNKTLPLAVVLAMAVGGGTWLATTVLADSPQGQSINRGMEHARETGNQTGSDINRAASDLTDANYQQIQIVRQLAGNLTESALKKGGFNDIVNTFAKADRERIMAENVDYSDLDKRIDQFRSDWKSKYNQDFQIQNPNAVFNSLQVVPGADAKHLTALISSPVSLNNGQSGLNNSAVDPSRSGTSSGNQAGQQTSGQQASGSSSGGRTMNGTVTQDQLSQGEQALGQANSSGIGGSNQTGTTGGNAQGNTSALVKSPLAVTLHLINEGNILDTWRLESPGLSGQQLRDNLIKCVSKLDQNKDQWPSDSLQAQQKVSYEILSAICNPQQQTAPSFSQEQR